jgi:hypothetical protein
MQHALYDTLVAEARCALDTKRLAEQRKRTLLAQCTAMDAMSKNASDAHQAAVMRGYSKIRAFDYKSIYLHNIRLKNHLPLLVASTQNHVRLILCAQLKGESDLWCADKRSWSC